MSTIVGLSAKEIEAIADAEDIVRKLHYLTGEERQKAISETLIGVMRRTSMQWGSTPETRPGHMLLHMIKGILPPEEEDEPANSG